MSLVAIIASVIIFVVTIAVFLYYRRKAKIGQNQIAIVAKPDPCAHEER